MESGFTIIRLLKVAVFVAIWFKAVSPVFKMLARMLSALIVVLAIIKIQTNASNAHNSAKHAHHLHYVILAH